MNVWLCPVKLRNWRIIKSRRLFGVPKRGLKTFNRVRPDDLLVFHVLKPINGIVAICKVVSNVFEDHNDVWGKTRYPFRVRIELIPGLVTKEDKTAPLSLLFGKVDIEKGIRIEPYLKNVWITRISEKNFRKLKEFFASATK